MILRDPFQPNRDLLQQAPEPTLIDLVLVDKLGRAGDILLGAEFHIQVLKPSVPHSSCLTGT